MSEQSWNFAGIEGGAGAIQGAVHTTQGLLDEGKSSLSKLSAAWGGSGSEAYHTVQQHWDSASHDLNDALKNLSQRISEASQTMSQTESGVTGMFS
jgi:early secretory antigenic target protein ESAT-6